MRANLAGQHAGVEVGAVLAEAAEGVGGIGGAGFRDGIRSSKLTGCFARLNQNPA
jgi:hypothetical protein